MVYLDVGIEELHDAALADMREGQARGLVYGDGPVDFPASAPAPNAVIQLGGQARNAVEVSGRECELTQGQDRGGCRRWRSCSLGSRGWC